MQMDFLQSNDGFNSIGEDTMLNFLEHLGMITFIFMCGWLSYALSTYWRDDYELIEPKNCIFGPFHSQN